MRHLSRLMAPSLAAFMGLGQFPACWARKQPLGNGSDTLADDLG